MDRSAYESRVTDKEKYDVVRYSLAEVEEDYYRAKEALDALEQSLLTFKCSLKSYFPEVNDCPF